MNTTRERHAGFSSALKSFIKAVGTAYRKALYSCLGNGTERKMSTKTTVFYKDFGAVGDGVTDDFKAIFAAHAYANKNGLPVAAESGKVYLIGKAASESIIIKTSTDWTGAEIVIDDREIAPSDPEAKVAVFKVASDYSSVYYDADSEVVRTMNQNGGIKTTTEKLPYAPGHTVMLIPYNSERKVYIRYGLNASQGSAQHEVMIVDKDGKIDKSTPPLLDYDKITGVSEIIIDDEPITLRGGLFHTRANQAPSAYTYYNRNISICRSNVTLEGMCRLITDEGDHGAPYGAFLAVNGVNNITVTDCTFQAHRYYFNEDPSTGGPTPMGTYEISATNANNVYYKNCRQTNYYDRETGEPSNRFFDADGNLVGHGVWGVMGSNYSKNLTYDGCKLNRYDAHAGVYNATIINSEVMYICLIGGGCARIENSIIYGNSIVILRSDYGSFWSGDMIIKNTKFVARSKNATLIAGDWYNHYFGYKTALPNVYIDGLTVEGVDGDIVVFNNYTRGRDIGVFTGATVTVDGVEVENNNPMYVPERIYVKNGGGRVYRAAPEGAWMRDAVEIVTE